MQTDFIEIDLCVWNPVWRCGRQGLPMSIMGMTFLVFFRLFMFLGLFGFLGREGLVVPRRAWWQRLTGVHTKTEAERKQ